MQPTESLVKSFRENGYVVLEQVITAAELKALDEETRALINDGNNHRDNPDYFFHTSRRTGEEAFYRVQYLFDKTPNGSLRTLAAHPRILEITAALHGEDFICTGEALVFKSPGYGQQISVHTDCDQADPAVRPDHLFFNVDIYLDDATEENGCLLAAPGSHKTPWPMAEIQKLGFDFPGLRPIPVRAGDVIIHDTRCVHGSHLSRAQQLRRTIYYEYQKISDLQAVGYPCGNPVPAGWLENRQRILMHAHLERQLQPFAADETPFPLSYSAGNQIEPAPSLEALDLRPRLGYSQFV